MTRPAKEPRVLRKARQGLSRITNVRSSRRAPSWPYGAKGVLLRANGIFVVSLLSMLTLTACGFKPMYGANATGQTITRALADIAIDPVGGPIDARLSQQVRNALLDRISPLGRPADARYRLTVAVTEDREDVGLRQDASVTRANVSLNAQFQLVDTETDAPVLTSNAWVATSYDVTQQDFSTVTAQQAAERRLTLDLAEDIRTQLALHFSRNEASSP